MNSELWAHSLREGELQSEPAVDRNTPTRRAMSPGRALKPDQLMFLKPSILKHSRSLSNPSPHSPEAVMPPASLLFSDITPETSPMLCADDFMEEFDNLLALPQKPREIDPSLLLRRKSILEKGRHSTSQFDQLVSSQLPCQGFLHKQDSNEGFLNIVERLGSSFEKYRHKRQDSSSSVQSAVLTPPLQALHVGEKFRHDFLGFVNNPNSDLGIPGFSSLFSTPQTNVAQEAEKMACYWRNCPMNPFTILPGLGLNESAYFMGQDELVNHITNDHIGIGQSEYFCEWKDCPRQGMPFAKKHKINNHIRIHTGERPFVCMFPGCDKKFARQDGLSTHSKTHSSVKPFFCSYPGCRKAYYHSRSLKKHEKSHVLKKHEKSHVGSANDFPSQNSWDGQDMEMSSNRVDHLQPINYS